MRIRIAVLSDVVQYVEEQAACGPRSGVRVSRVEGLEEVGRVRGDGKRTESERTKRNSGSEIEWLLARCHPL